jgi:SAM-dependent methyltransferase
MSMHSAYYDDEAVAREVAAGRHREAIGGLWDELGHLQLDFLKSRGLAPSHRLLDVGCGSLRLGRLAVDYLEPGHYFGIDLSDALIQAGYERELSGPQRARLPRGHLVATADFDLAALPGDFDIAIAQSVFTHLPLNHVRRCVAKVAERLVPGGVFFATAWLVPDGWPLTEPCPQSGAIDGVPIITRDIADPYHYRLDDFARIADDVGVDFHPVGAWGHPRSMPMLAFSRP